MKNAQAQLVNTMTRLRNPISSSRWTIDHDSQASRPVSFMPISTAIACDRPITAIVPRSVYLNGPGCLVAPMRLAITLAT